VVCHAWPQAAAIEAIFWRPELRGAVCSLYSRLQWFLLLPRGWASAYGPAGVGEGAEGDACPPFAARLVPLWSQIVLGSVAPLAIAYFMEARAKTAFLRAQGLSVGEPGDVGTRDDREGAGPWRTAWLPHVAAAAAIVALATHAAWFSTLMVNAAAL